MYKPWLFGALSIFSLSGCPQRECEKKVDVYDMDSVLPMGELPVGDVMGNVTARQEVELWWTGVPGSDDETFPELPYQGSEDVTVAVEHDGSSFESGYYFDHDDGHCYANATPHTRVSAHVWSKSGRIDERFEGDLTVNWEGKLELKVDIADLHGSARDYEAVVDRSGLYDDTSTQLSLTFLQDGNLSSVSAELVGVTHYKNGEGANYLELFSSEGGAN
jgi:hypothetical protein